jgi:hypothetical protein
MSTNRHYRQYDEAIDQTAIINGIERTVYEVE